MAIGDYPDKHNGNPKPFGWDSYSERLPRHVKRALKALNIGQSDLPHYTSRLRKNGLKHVTA